MKELTLLNMRTSSIYKKVIKMRQALANSTIAKRCLLLLRPKRNEFNLGS